MATATEVASQPGSDDKAAGLIAAISLISGEQTYTFDLYKRLVLPLDGFVFWVKASQINDSIYGKGALYKLHSLDAKGFAEANKTLTLTPQQQAVYQFSINGSLHVSQDLAQEEDTTYVSQNILFTTKNEVTHFANIAPDEMYVMTIPNGAQVAFGQQRNHYTLAGLWHYNGKAVYSTLADQIVNDIAKLNTNSQIISNSLPFWLALSTPSVPVYPSFLSPKNLTPPYVTADITQTTSLASSPYYFPNSSQSQLVTDTINFTMYGLNNDAALDFQQSVLQTSEFGNYGIMNMPVPVDEKKTQVEFLIIAQKTMTLQVNYYQHRARAIAQKMVSQALVGWTPIPHNFPVPIYF
jgi:hypothetical protein